VRVITIHPARGDLDEALLIRGQEQLPVYERLGDVRELLICRAKIAMTLMSRKEGGDQEEANTLLCVALAARRLGIPEAEQIGQIMQHFGMTCG
jgi:hypothetical protein